MHAVSKLRSIEICAGAGGQALGLEQAGFAHVALAELDPWACKTLRQNRPGWNVIEEDLRALSFSGYRNIDLLAGGVPCPPFSRAGKQLGADDERDLFPEALRLAQSCKARALMLENVRGLLDPKFADYRGALERRLRSLGYKPFWKLLHASDFGVPQLRPRTVLVALAADLAPYFRWPEPDGKAVVTVGEILRDLMAESGWRGADNWSARAGRIAPTLVGGSKKHGGPDLGPTRAKRAWAELGVCGLGIADAPPEPNFEGKPRLTVRMAATLQGFPASWQFAGRKTAAYRQVGNAFPPPVAAAVGGAIARAFEEARESAAESTALAA
jgi:DNA (cytosine-5)-methyltransferase 1